MIPVILIVLGSLQLFKKKQLFFVPKEQIKKKTMWDKNQGLPLRETPPTPNSIILKVNIGYKLKIHFFIPLRKHVLLHLLLKPLYFLENKPVNGFYWWSCGNHSENISGLSTQEGDTLICACGGNGSLSMIIQTANRRKLWHRRASHTSEMVFVLLLLHPNQNWPNLPTLRSTRKTKSFWEKPPGF